MLNKLPVEIQQIVLTNLEEADLKNTAEVSKQLRVLSLAQLTTAYPNSLNSKTLPAGTDYYAVGPMIKTSEPSSLLDKGFPYPKARKSIPNAEVKAAIPQSGIIKLFRSQQEAEQYASLTQEYRHGADDSYKAAVFHVQLKESTVGQVIKKDITSSSFLPISKKEKTPVEYVIIDASKLNFISGEVPGYQEAKDTKKCIVM